MGKAPRKRKLMARVTHLQMTAPSERHVPVPLGPKIAVMRASAMPPAFYRFLYAEVGRPHHWGLRRALSNEALTAEIHSASCEISVLYVDGSPAGFFELDLSRLVDEAEILYFGLVPYFQGRGLARFFLAEAIAAAWAHAPALVTIHTNTLDSPRALQLYQKAGFEPVGWSEEEVEAWD